jgi:hypothetical protein
MQHHVIIYSVKIQWLCHEGLVHSCAGVLSLPLGLQIVAYMTQVKLVIAQSKTLRCLKCMPTGSPTPFYIFPPSYRFIRYTI